MISTQTSNLTVRLDAQLKKDAEKLFNDLGMTLSGAINVFLHQSLEQQGLPFQVRKKTSEPRNARRHEGGSGAGEDGRRKDL